MKTATTSYPRFESPNTVARIAASFLAGLRRAFELSGAPYADGALPPL
jgi:hypothetical protein